MIHLTKIRKQFEDVIEYSQGFRPPKAQSTKVIKNWFNAKKPFIKK